MYSDYLQKNADSAEIYRSTFYKTSVNPSSLQNQRRILIYDIFG